MIRFVSLANRSPTYNSEFKGLSGPTNILTFSGRLQGADIAICPQIAAEDAVVRGWDLERELIYLADSWSVARARIRSHVEFKGAAERMRRTRMSRSSHRWDIDSTADLGSAGNCGSARPPR